MQGSGGKKCLGATTQASGAVLASWRWGQSNGKAMIKMSSEKKIQYAGSNKHKIPQITALISYGQNEVEDGLVLGQQPLLDLQVLPLAQHSEDKASDSVILERSPRGCRGRALMKMGASHPVNITSSSSSGLGEQALASSMESGTWPTHAGTLTAIAHQ